MDQEARAARDRSDGEEGRRQATTRDHPAIACAKREQVTNGESPGDANLVKIQHHFLTVRVVSVYCQYLNTNAIHTMTSAGLQHLAESDLIRKRLAKLMALRCFRNTYLEELHAGIVPQTKTGDFADVRVVDSEREIPWARLSRLSDPEMKGLMIEVVDHCYDFLSMLSTSTTADALLAELAQKDPVPEWYDPVGWKARKSSTAGAAG
jgi:hypothetical protein